jgi:hypothetical protein
MNALPEVAALRAFLERTQRRIKWIAALQGAAVGLAIATLLLVVVVVFDFTERGAAAGLLLGVTGALIGGALALQRKKHVAHAVEERAPECRNLVITAAELIDRPERVRVRPYINELVLRRATAITAQLDPHALFPARGALAQIALAVIVWGSAFTLVLLRPALFAGGDVLRASTDLAEIKSIDVTVTPPAYTRQPAFTLRDPARIQAVAGSRVRMSVSAYANAATIQTVNSQTALQADSGRFVGEFSADADGFVVVAATNERGSARRLIGLVVTADQSPRVRITTPGRDLLLPDARRTIDVSVESEDDLALGSLALRYTKVSGSGEQFTFTEGELPLQVARVNEKKWTGRSALGLEALALGPGDMVVYRALASDRRPGAAAVESDAFIVEITAPGAVAMEGVSIDEEEDKYALSQQMVILKTERLLARAPGMPADSVALQARTIGAEQRSVRAEFVFMMGGELAEEVLEAAGITDLDETAHAEADDEVIAGRLANRGRLDLLNAIRAMSRASTALNAPDLTRALAAEKVALASLQRAFSRTRYILRALTRRERLDLSRRLTGQLADLGRNVRPRSEPTLEPRVNALRTALADVAALAGDPAGREGSARAAHVAQSVLQIDPASVGLQRVAELLNNAAAALANGRVSESQALLDQAAVSIAAEVRSALALAPPAAPALETRRVQGALSDVLRGTRTQR